MHIKKVILLSLFVHTMLNASTMFTLTGINKLYPVVEISAKSIPKAYKNITLESLKEVTDDLKIDTKGYDPRSLAVLVNEMQVGDISIINIQLLIGEEVRRLESDEKTFAITYQSKEHFLLNKGDDLEDKFEEALDTLLLNFSEQYAEENKKISKVVIDEKNFAAEMHYETNYEEAVKKSKKLHKNIMLVLVSNFCPWCRKFEQRVLLKKEVNDMIQKNYIPLILNREKKDFPKQFDTGFTPVVYFIGWKTQKSYQNIIGYNNKDDFTYMLRSDTLTQ